MPVKSGQYYRTEQEIAKLLQSSGLPLAFTNPFTKDYAAVKGDIAVGDENLAAIELRVDNLDARVTITESEISSLNSDVTSLNSSVLSLTLQAADFEVRITQAEGDIVDHVNSNEEHGSNGPIVGTDDYCTAGTGGTVLLAAALTVSPTSTLIITSTPTAPSAAYVQAEAITWVDTINELKTDFNALVAEYNALVAKVNDIILTQESANQRAS